MVRLAKIVPLLSCLPLLAIPLSGHGHFPAVFGRDFIILEQPARDRQSPLPAVPAEPPARPGPEDMARLEQALSALEHAGGPYTLGLYEPLSQLGRMHRDRGDYDAARELYERALHVVRVNEGLLGRQQVPLLRELLALYRQLGDLERLDQGYQYFFRVFGSGQPPFGEARKAALREYLDWQHEAQSLAIPGDTNARLVELYRVTGTILEEAAADPEPDLQWQRELVFTQLRNLYLILGELPVAEQVSGRNAAGASEAGSSASSEFMRQRMTTLQRTGVARGRILLTEFLERWPGLSGLERAAVRLELANWYQWNEKYQSAEAEYREVIALLRQEGAEQLLVDWFDRAAELPENGAFIASKPDSDGGEPIVLQADFRVSAWGNVSDIEITAVSAESGNRVLRLKQWLRETHFRPRFLADGERVDSRLRRSYQLFR